MRVDVSCVLLRENNLGFWCIRLTLTFNVRRVLYIQYFMSVPPVSGDSLPASSELRLSIALNSMELAPSTLFEPHRARFSSRGHVRCYIDERTHTKSIHDKCSEVWSYLPSCLLS